MRIVIALGGNALLRRGEPMTTEAQRRNIRIAAGAIAPLAAGHSVVVAHGNGPQVGLLSLQAEAYKGAEPYPLDVLDAGPARSASPRALTCSWVSRQRRQRRAMGTGSVTCWPAMLSVIRPVPSVPAPERPGHPYGGGTGRF